MAENKKGFLMYADQMSIVKKLLENDKKNGTNNAGELFLHLLEYVNDKDPVPVNDIVDISFEPIKMQLKRDLVKYEGIKRVRSEWGKKGGEKSGEARKKQKEANEAKASKSKQTQANEAVTDTVTDTVTDINKSNPLWIPIEKLGSIMLAEVSWHVVAHRDLNITIEQVKSWIGRFVLKLEAEAETGKTLKDAKSYFIRWTKIELTKPENKSQNTIDQNKPAAQKPKGLNL